MITPPPAPPRKRRGEKRKHKGAKSKEKMAQLHCERKGAENAKIRRG
jgi:hypothetical protein